MGNKGYWTLDRQYQMCHGISHKIFQALNTNTTTMTKQIIIHADKFPVGLKQYYADRLLLHCIVIEKIIESKRGK